MTCKTNCRRTCMYLHILACSIEMFCFATSAYLWSEWHYMRYESVCQKRRGTTAWIIEQAQRVRDKRQNNWTLQSTALTTFSLPGWVEVSLVSSTCCNLPLALLLRATLLVLQRLQSGEVVDICQLLQDELREPRSIMMKAMAQRAELRVHAFSDFSGEAIEDLLVALQTWQACLLAPCTRMSCSVKLINDEVKIGQTSCHRRISLVAQTHSFQVAAVIMNNACETGQPVRTLGSEMKTLRQWFCSNKLHDIQEQAGLGDSKKETSSACGSMGIFATLLVGPASAFLSRLGRMPWC